MQAPRGISSKQKKYLGTMKRLNEMGTYLSILKIDCETHVWHFKNISAGKSEYYYVLPKVKMSTYLPIHFYCKNANNTINSNK